MSVILRTPPPNTLLQRYRDLMEGFLMTVAQEEMVRKYPGMGTQPYPKTGWIYTALRRGFLPVYGRMPWPLRQQVLRLFFVRGPQRWKKR